MRRFLIFSLLAIFTLSACSSNKDVPQDVGEEQASVVTVYRDPT